jgi:hypothetical protein
VFLGVVHYDAGGKQTGFNEVKSVRGDSRWSREPMRMAMKPAPGTASIRLCIGLVSASEAYADTDSVR